MSPPGRGTSPLPVRCAGPSSPRPAPRTKHTLNRAPRAAPPTSGALARAALADELDGAPRWPPAASSPRSASRRWAWCAWPGGCATSSTRTSHRPRSSSTGPWTPWPRTSAASSRRWRGPRSRPTRSCRTRCPRGSGACGASRGPHPTRACTTCRSARGVRPRPPRPAHRLRRRPRPSPAARGRRAAGRRPPRFARPETARAALTEHELTATDRGEVRAPGCARTPGNRSTWRTARLCRLSVFHGAPGTDTSWVLLNASPPGPGRRLCRHPRQGPASRLPERRRGCRAHRRPPVRAARRVRRRRGRPAGRGRGRGPARVLARPAGRAACPSPPSPRTGRAPPRSGAARCHRGPAGCPPTSATASRGSPASGASTRPAVFLAAHQVLLRQYTQQDDLVVGMPVSTRPGGGLRAGTVGHFVTMVPVRTRTSGGRTFAELCADVQGTLLDALAHAYPFGPLVRELGLGTADGSAPVFRHAFMYQDWHEDVTAETPASATSTASTRKASTNSSWRSSSRTPPRTRTPSRRSTIRPCSTPRPWTGCCGSTPTFWSRPRPRTRTGRSTTARRPRRRSSYPRGGVERHRRHPARAGRPPAVR